MLSAFEAKDLIQKRGLRTDSSLTAIRLLNRLENVGETLTGRFCTSDNHTAALNSLATAAPEWLASVADPEWYLRYEKRIEDYRLPKSKEERKELAETIGRDGKMLLDAVYSNDAPS